MSSGNSPHRVLIVEDEPVTAAHLRLLLEAAGFEVRVRSDVSSARRDLDRHGADALVCDVELPDGTGLDIVRAVREALPDLPIVIVTGHRRFDVAVEALRCGADELFEKPADGRRLVATLHRLLDREERGATADYVDPPSPMR